MKELWNEFELGRSLGKLKGRFYKPATEGGGSLSRHFRYPDKQYRTRAYRVKINLTPSTLTSRVLAGVLRKPVERTVPGLLNFERLAPGTDVWSR